MKPVARPLKFAVILSPQQLDFLILQDLANAQISVDPEVVDLLFGQRLAHYRCLVPICGLHCLFSRNLSCFVWPFFVYGRLRAQTPSGGSGPLRRACAPFAAKAAQGCRRQTPAAARGYALFGRSGLRPSLVRGDTPRNAPLQKHASPTIRLHRSSEAVHQARTKKSPDGVSDNGLRPHTGCGSWLSENSASTPSGHAPARPLAVTKN